MALTAWSAYWFLPFALPICVWVAWNDMKFMKIPNIAVLALAGVFVILSPIALPLAEIPWRLLNLVVVLVAGFILNLRGSVGAGDAKFAAAAAPFIATGDIAIALYLFSAALLAAFGTHRLARATPWFRRLTPDWQSWQAGDFPMGLALGATLVFYLLAGAIFGL